nr:hypothetical protein [Bacteroidota bacterium]
MYFRALTILIFFIAFRTWGSEPSTISIVEDAAYPFSYDLNENGSIGNSFIMEIARINYLNLYRTNYSLQFKHEVTISESDGTLWIESNIVSGEMSGDIFYQTFNLTDVLIPASYDFKLEIYTGNGAIVDVLDFTGNSTEAKMESKHKYSSEFQLTDITLKLVDFHFNYLHSDMLKLQERIGKINQFLAFTDVTDYLLQNRTKVTLRDTSRMLSAFIDMYHTGRFLNMLKHQDSILDVRIPETLMNAFETNSNRLISGYKRDALIFKQLIGSYAYNATNGDIYLAAKDMIRLQTGYITALENTNYLFEPVYLEMARVFSDSQVWVDFTDQLKTNFTAFDWAYLPLQQAFYEAYFEGAKQYMDGERYNEAIILLESAETICHFGNTIDCSLEAFHEQSKARYGIYESYHRIAKSAMQGNNLSLALLYLNKASEFQHANAAFIISDDMTLELIEELAWKFIESGREHNKQARFEMAISDFMVARELYNAINLSDYIADINHELCEAQIGVLKNLMDRIDSVIVSGVVSCQHFIRAEIAVIRDKFSIFQSFDQADCEGEIGNLIKSAEFIMAKIEFTQQVHQSIGLANQQQYIDARNHFESAKVKFAGSPVVDGLNNEAHSIISHYEEFFDYLVMLSNAENQYLDENRIGCLEIFNSIETFYNDHEIVRFGIADQSLEMFLQRKTH